jgi:uncharacterized protein (TIGR03437 family)
MSTTDNTIHSSINVLAWPGAIALSPDSRHLVVAHYCNGVTTPACTNALTSIDLTANSQQTLSLASPPLGLAFLSTGQALVVTTTQFLTFNPSTGQTALLGTIANVAASLATSFGTFPGEILQTQLATSKDGSTIWGIASAGAANQLIFRCTAPSFAVSASFYITSPPLLPRISPAADGSYAMVGYALIDASFTLRGRYPTVLASTNITGSAVDSVNGVVYSQIPDTNQPTGPSGTHQPAMVLMDSDNLTYRDRITIPEDMVGRAVLSSNGANMYAISESGVMVLPVGSLNSSHRVQATQEDILVATNFCNRGVLSQSLTITDPGGGQTDFTVKTSQPGITILPAGGVTPATVQVFIDPTVVPSSGGTNAIFLNISSVGAVNNPRPVRLLINNPDPSQRGTVIDQPGMLTDILPDPARNRFYVVRQDMNQVIVLDAGSMSALATLRTATSPNTMAMTLDGHYLLVGHDDAQVLMVYDLNSLQWAGSVVLPGGHFSRSIAVSNAGILALVRSEGSDGPALIDSVNLQAGTAAPPASLGIFKNAGSLSSQAVLAPSPSGANILYAAPDGTVALYTAAANTFVNSRKDLSSLGGAYAASDYGLFVVGNSFFNSSLVPAGAVSSSALPSSGFSFVAQGGYMASAVSPSSAGSVLKVNSLPATSSSPVLVSEAPLLPGGTAPILGGWGIDGSGAVSTHAQFSFVRSIAPMIPNNGASASLVALLSTSGVTVLASDYSAGVVTPSITGIASAADGSASVAPDELVSIYGRNLSQISFSASSTPLSTSLGDSCLGVNGQPIPLLYVSSQQINGQLPAGVIGNAALTIHTPGGISNTFNFTVQPAAPSVFTAATGPEGTVATIVRNDDNQLVTPTNPVHPNDRITIYLTGLGQTAPLIAAGQPAPGSPLAVAAIAPSLSLGGAALSVSYAGMVPGSVGLYQIDATVPNSVTTGLTVPLVISQGGASTSLSVRVVN